MADKKVKNGPMFDVSFSPEKVRSANITRYKGGYSYATISCEPSDNEYMSVSYEWNSEAIPEFALNVMEVMKSIGKEKASLTTDADALERAAKVLMDRAAKLKKDSESI